MRVRGTTTEIDDVARQMRAAPTPAETLLWEQLRLRPSGTKFRRQHAVGRFVFDFICVPARLVIEVDGPIHNDTEPRDRYRDAVIRAAGYRVLRFNNDEVFEDVLAVVATIVSNLSAPSIGGSQALVRECTRGPCD